MRCRACNKILSESEARRKFALSGQYVELCNKDAVWVDVLMTGSPPEYLEEVMENTHDDAAED